MKPRIFHPDKFLRFIFTTALVIILIFLAKVNLEAARYGYNYNLLNPFEINNYMKKSPLRDDKNIELENLLDKVIILYKFDCPDCHDSYKYFKAYFEDENLLFIPKDSRLGKTISTVYGIEAVPTAIYFENFANPMIKPLYYKTFNYQNFKDILDEAGYSKEF